MPDDRPNILVLMTDQQRLDTVSAYGLNPNCLTPHIDALAMQGVRFNNAFTPTSICSPARASFYTGLYPHKHGVTANGLCLGNHVKGINHYLEDAGYACGYTGKWHIDQKRGPSDFGFVAKDFLGYAFPASKLLPGLQFAAAPLNTPNHYEAYLKERGLEIPSVSERFVGANPANQAQEMFALHEGPLESCIEYFVAEETIRVMEQLVHTNRPFFLWANFWGPHTPCLIPEPYFSMYDPGEIPMHPGYYETFEGKPYVQRLIEKFWGLGDYGWKGFQEISARYYGHCSLIDDMVGRILAALESIDQAGNTVVIFTADHGDCMGAHKLIEKGAFMYDETYRIPLIVAHPACEAPGSAHDDFLYLHEVMCSILDIAGLDVPPNLDGQSFLPAMRGQGVSNGREEVYCVFDRHFTVANQRMVRTYTHQLTFNAHDTGELYDLINDPYQLQNLYHVPEYNGVRQNLMGRMGNYMVELKDPLYRWFRGISGVY